MIKNLKIAILGTRGIPNKYGGFEQFAEYLSVGLVERGHRVTVYNPHFYTVEGSIFKGVNIINKYSPESWLGAAANFVYDYLSLRDALKRNFDIILECGYGTASLSYYVCPIDKTILVTNMDGLEWKRTKWNDVIKKMMKIFEKWGAEWSHELVADNEGIQLYLENEYRKQSTMIPYGADVFRDPDFSLISDYEITKGNYFLLIARLEPENNIDIILEGYLASDTHAPFLVIGNYDTRYGKFLMDKFSGQRDIRFLGSIFDNDITNNLRYFASLYFHGHSVGGTNPSLLEAMACGSHIIAHENEFNKAVLHNGGYFFSNSRDITNYLNNFENLNENRAVFLERNLNRIEKVYNWQNIIDQYETLFKRLVVN